jgi:hypothetical protein
LAFIHWPQASMAANAMGQRKDGIGLHRVYASAVGVIVFFRLHGFSHKNLPSLLTLIYQRLTPLGAT